MAHVIIIYDEYGNAIGEYYPEHDPETGGRVAARCTLNESAVAESLQRSIGDKSIESVEVKFKGK